ncbi:MAG TPA: hypothetical protein VMC84_13630 [Methanocella sp.]|uniref:hypothetical protein n=1 Tax=Methanocella sp. TaxID=2052833 RepID=UPI002C5D8E7B|nr:hypothetical protein [Methanocella sp.]HTY92211.1 hypothetical protein [Methanocella sp.]
MDYEVSPAKCDFNDDAQVQKAIVDRLASWSDRAARVKDHGDTEAPRTARFFIHHGDTANTAPFYILKGADAALSALAYPLGDPLLNDITRKPCRRASAVPINKKRRVRRVAVVYAVSMAAGWL